MPVWSLDQRFINLTENAVNSLGKEITIIDNGSTFGAGQLREWADPYVRNRENRGYAIAVNQGLKLSKDKIVAIANNDIRVSEGWEDIALDILRDPLVMSVHFKMIAYDELFNLGDKVWITGKERWCTNSFFVMRNNELFDENFLNTYDDWDLHLRMYQNGFKTAYTNKASYQHMDSFTQQFTSDRESINSKNRDYFIKKYGDNPENIWLKMFPEQMNQDYRKGFE